MQCSTAIKNETKKEKKSNYSKSVVYLGFLGCWIDVRVRINYDYF